MNVNHCNFVNETKTSETWLDTGCVCIGLCDWLGANGFSL